MHRWTKEGDNLYRIRRPSADDLEWSEYGRDLRGWRDVLGVLLCLAAVVAFWGLLWFGLTQFGW